MRGVPMVETSYQRKLYDALSHASSVGDDSAIRLLRAMHVATGGNEYSTLPALHAKLWPPYAARVGPPPSSREDDQ